jgi:hypothetical protein
MLRTRTPPLSIISTILRFPYLALDFDAAAIRFYLNNKCKNSLARVNEQETAEVP